MKLLAWFLVGSLALVLSAWAGLRVPAGAFDDLDVEDGEVAFVALPDGLPAPVERFFRTLYGDEVPVIDTAVITGRGTMRVVGITLPVRWRFTHRAGEAYRHEIESTLYRMRTLTIDELYIDGRGRLELPFGVSEGPNVDQGADLALWAEAIWMPSVWITDERVRWEPVDAHTALLIVPSGAATGHGGTEAFVARFDPGTGLLRLLESMRFRDVDDDERILWRNEVVSWETLGEVGDDGSGGDGPEGDGSGGDGRGDGAAGSGPAGFGVAAPAMLPIGTELTWFDHGRPWARLTTEDVRYNVPLTEDVRPAG